MRVVFVLPGLSRHAVGGYRVVYEYANRLCALGDEVTVVHARVLPGSPSGSLRTRAAGLRRESMTRARPGWFELDSGIAVRNRPVATDAFIPECDVLVATSAVTAPFVAQLVERRGIGGVYFVQGFESWSGVEFIHRTWKLPLHVVTLSTQLQNLLSAQGVEAVVVENGIDQSFFTPGPVPASRSIDVVAMLSRHPWKRSDICVDVLNDLAAERPGFAARTFGVHSRPSNLADEIVHTVSPAPERLRSLYQSARIYLCTSDHEGWHLPPAEAMSCGSVVVSTDILGVRGYADGVASFAPTGDRQALREAVVRLLDTPVDLGERSLASIARIGRYSASAAASAFRDELVAASQMKGRPVS